MQKDILTIGPITKDIIIKKGYQLSKIGGSAYYMSNIISQLNRHVTTIITLGENDLELVEDFPSNKLEIISTKETMEYTNTYSEDLTRTQKAHIPENPITVEKLEKLDIKYEDYSIVLIAPLCKYDIPLETIKFLKEKNLLTILMAQGFLRETDSYGNVIETPWHCYEEYLEYTDILSFDKEEVKKAFQLEDINFENIRKIIKTYNMDQIIITKAENGSTIYTKDRQIDIAAIKCENPNDPTGLGDTFIGAYAVELNEKKSLEESGLFASACAKLKLENRVDSLISEKKVEEELKNSTRL